MLTLQSQTKRTFTEDFLKQDKSVKLSPAKKPGKPGLSRAKSQRVNKKPTDINNDKILLPGERAAGDDSFKLNRNSKNNEGEGGCKC